MTINHTEFNQFLDAAFDGKGILHVLKDNGIDITANGGEVIEKTGLIALAGAIKGIDRGLIPQGTKILCCLTGGISDADGKAVPEYKG